MDRDSLLELVRTLTKDVMTAVRPEKMTTFTEDFAASVIGGGLLRVE